jgi:diguanylate cyclase (GGDEF)-like protein
MHQVSGSATIVSKGDSPSSDTLDAPALYPPEEIASAAAEGVRMRLAREQQGPERRSHMPLGFGLALLVLLVLAVSTQRSIAAFIAANAAVTRSLQALEQLQALKAVAREVETNRLALVLTGQQQHQDSYAGALAEISRVDRNLREFLDSPRQRPRLQQLGKLTREASAFLRGALASGSQSSRDYAGARIGQGRDSSVTRRLITAIGGIEQEERQTLEERQTAAASRAREARTQVLVASVVAFVTILIAGLMVRRDVLERRNATDRLERANATLAGAVAEAQRRREEITRLARLSHFLQGCRTPEEAYLVIQKTAPTLFGAAGALYVAIGSRFERAAAWDEGCSLEQAFSGEACWGIRQGNIHETHHESAAPGCDHLAGAPDATCVPLAADGASFGLLVIASDGTAADPAAARATLLAAVEQISVGLANLRLREALQIQSFRDPLTGLYNRRFLQDALSRECHDARRHPDRPVSLMLLDLDFFKRVNDTSGHAAGDALLQALAALLGRTFRGSDIACRFGGEEFAIVLAETPLGVALRRAEALRLAIHGLRARHGSTVIEGLTASIGVTAGSGELMTPEQLLEEADSALYEAKARGRDCCVPYDVAPGMRPLPFDMPPAAPPV